MRFRIDNEYDPLRSAMVHRPGMEIDRLTHDNAKTFLFEDVPYLRRMQDEHDAFVATMREHGVEVVYVENYLLDILKDEQVRAALLSQICAVDATPTLADALALMKHWQLEELVEILFAGITVDEYEQRVGHPPAGLPESNEAFLLSPIPNAYFARDPAVVVRDAAISSKMHYRERVRETLITRAVLENHPDFLENPITYGGSSEPTEDRPYTIEGGDVIVLSAEAVLIGASERTRSETIERLAAKCFQFGNVNRVYEIPIPTERAFMHLDTVFTIIDRGKVLWYPDVIQQIRYIHRYERNESGGARGVPEERNLEGILRDEFACDLTTIHTAGGKKPHAAKEQRMDGANVLAIAPSVGITYVRNEHTTRELEKHGVTCLGIDDSELVRGLGGPRCMTMPLRRSP